MIKLSARSDNRAQLGKVIAAKTDNLPEKPHAVSYLSVDTLTHAKEFTHTNRCAYTDIFKQ